MKLPQRRSFQLFKDVGLVYLLTLVGLVVGTASVMVTAYTSRLTREAHARTEVSRTAAIEASNSSSEASAAATFMCSELLDTDAAFRAPTYDTQPAFESLERLTAKLSDSDMMEFPEEQKKGIAARIDGKKQLILDLADLVASTKAWRLDWIENENELNRQKKELAKSLHRLRASVADAQGHSRLEVVITLPRLRSESAESDDTSVDDLVAKVRKQHSIGHIATELSSLSLLVEVLVAVRDESSLVDLRDNQFKPALVGLTRAIKTLRLTDPELSERLESEAETVAGSLMCRGVLDDTSDREVGGVFGALLEQVKLRERSQRVGAARRMIEARQATVEKNFDSACSEIASAYSEVASRESGRAARASFFVAVLGGAAFLVLAWRVALRIRTQLSALKRTNRDLDHMVVVAEAAGRSKDIFLANMSHEIRTPMNGILGVVSLLEDTPLNSAQQSYLEIMQKSGQALLTLINDILDYSKIEAGQMTLEKIDFDLVDTVFDVASLFAMSAHSKGIELFCEIDSSVETRRIGDPSRLRQVISNLVNNAVKFTERGSICLRVSPHGDDRLKFEISDTGIGISEEAQSRLFKSFSQADGSTTRRFGGTGLGLSICKHLVEGMSGRIGVISREGEGSTFQFEIECPAAEKQSQEPHACGAKVELMGFDELGFQSLGRMIVGVGGSLIRDGELAENENGILMVDTRHMDGDVASSLKSWQRPGCRLIVCTWRADCQAWQNQGAITLLKPVHPRELVRAISGREIEAAMTSAATGTGVADDAGKKIVEASDDLRVLIAEDNPINQRIAKAMLQKLGCQVSLAENGREAVDAMKRNSFDLVFMDCQMPEMDGFEATGLIRQLEDEARSKVQIVALTANAMQGDRERCIDAGMDDYLRKPIEKDLLKEVVERVRNSR